MTTTMKILLISAAVVLGAGACAGDDSSGAPSGTGTSGGAGSPPTATCPTEGEEFETTKLYIEHNATDEDTGVHGLFGGAGEGWTQLCLTDPDGNEILMATPEAQLGDLGVADVFFESREPPNAEYSVADLTADFPEGEYQVSAIDYQGTPHVGAATFTHDIPVQPTITNPDLAEDAETAAEATISAGGLEVRWDQVTETLAGDPLTVTGYEVIITDELHEDPHGLSKPMYDVHVPPDMTALSVPDEWLQPGTVYELEVLVLEESGNQTITVGFFQTP